MATVIDHVVGVVVPVLLCIAIGFGLAKLKQPLDNKMVTGLMANVGYPTLILSHLLAQSVYLSSLVWREVYSSLIVLCQYLPLPTSGWRSTTRMRRPTWRD